VNFKHGFSHCMLLFNVGELRGWPVFISDWATVDKQQWCIHGWYCVLRPSHRRSAV